MSGIWQGLRYAFYVIFHPFKGFWDLKHERKGNFGAAAILLLLVTVTFVARQQMSGFLFGGDTQTDTGVLLTISSVLLPFFLWCVSNWCVTTLMDGEGRFSDIVMVSAYALTPLFLIQLPLVLLSNVLTQSESGFYTFFMVVSVAWAAFLLVVGIMTVHQFTMGKTLGTILIALVGMVIMVFLFFLLFVLIQQMINFVLLLREELAMR